MPDRNLNWWEKRRRPVPSAPSVFVSHASGDRAQAVEVVRCLEAATIRCWIAPRDIPAGEGWADAIVDGLRRCQVLVVLLSGRSGRSPEVHREVELAARARLHMLTVRLDSRAELDGPLQYFLSSIQWIDATARPLRPQLQSLPSAVGALLKVPIVVPTLQVKHPRRRRDESDGRDLTSLDDLLRRGRPAR